jgi:hypothetical protein
MLSHVDRTIPFVAATALFASAAAAQANCKPLLDAMDKLGRQARVASS